MWMKKNILIVAAVALGIAFFEVWSRAEPLHVHKGGAGRWGGGVAGVIPTPSFSPDPGHHLHLLPDEGHPQRLRGHVAPPPKGHCAKPTHAQPLLLPPGVGGLQVGRGGGTGAAARPGAKPPVCQLSLPLEPPPPPICVPKGAGGLGNKRKSLVRAVCMRGGWRGEESLGGDGVCPG